MAQKKTQSAVKSVEESWGKAAPAWVRQLALLCDRSSQTDVAKKIGRSNGLVNMVLKNRYSGDLNCVKERVEKALSPNIDCPVLGDIAGSTCLDWQGKDFSSFNHVFVTMYKACRKCPNNLCEGKKS